MGEGGKGLPPHVAPADDFALAVGDERRMSTQKHYDWTAGVDVKLPFAMTGPKTTAATFQLANDDCSGCFRLEQMPGGVRTRWKAPPCHGSPRAAITEM
jgi:hypothetical protein